MTDQEFETELDAVIEHRNIAYHCDNFLKNVFGVHDLDDICDECKEIPLIAISKHIQDRIDALGNDEEEEGLSN
jgi:hypothetical protein